jgi:hypothetical protein
VSYRLRHPSDLLFFRPPFSNLCPYNTEQKEETLLLLLPGSVDEREDDEEEREDGNSTKSAVSSLDEEEDDILRERCSDIYSVAVKGFRRLV